MSTPQILDDKLRVVLNEVRANAIAWDANRGVRTDEAIADIKQAFREAGYKQGLTYEDAVSAATTLKFVKEQNLMTGQEFYDRFKAELIQKPTDFKYPEILNQAEAMGIDITDKKYEIMEYQILSAARRAAGVSE